jgi:hypothetical protein
MDYRSPGRRLNPHDFDILLMQKHKHGCVRRLRDKLDPIDKKISGNLEAQRQGAMKHVSSRDHGRQTHARDHPKVSAARICFGPPLHPRWEAVFLWRKRAVSPSMTDGSGLECRGYQPRSLAGSVSRQFSHARVQAQRNHLMVSAPAGFVRLFVGRGFLQFAKDRPHLPENCH